MDVRKLLLGIAFCSVASLATGQSLGEIAKQKPQKKAARVITNDEIPSRPDLAEAPKTPMGANASEAAEPADGNDGKDKPQAQAAKDKDEDSPELKAMQKQLEDMKVNMSERQQRTEELREKVKNETSEYRRNLGPTLLAARELDLQTMKQESEELQKKIEAKREEERKEREKQQSASGQ
jgi:hypothetical protein